MPANVPTIGNFDRDPRVHIDKVTGKYQYEDTDTGTEFEWTGNSWIPLVRLSCDWDLTLPRSTTV